MNLNRKVVHCPKTDEFHKSKILLLVGKDRLTVHCHEHGFIDIQLFSNGELITFDDAITARITDVPKGTNMNLQTIPALANGEFKTKKGKKRAFSTSS